MKPRLPHRALYAAFDRVPSAKGAALHIAHMVRAMERAAGDALLVCVADGRHPDYEREGALEVLRLARGAPEFVSRVAAYGAALARVLEAQRASLEVCHFRDPWSGIPILEAKGAWRTVYEVNGLPSIELPYRHPRLGERTLERIRALEQRCLMESSAVLTPSATVAKSLARLGIPPARITVVPNGATLADPGERPPEAPDQYVLYFGALQPWQGVGAAIAALAWLRDTEIRLVICSSHPPGIGRALAVHAARLGVAGRILWRHELSREALAPWIAHAVATLAPLAETARNLEQGCCPLKVVESMAARTPVIASDLAPVRELVRHGEEGLLVRPGRPELLARAIRRLAEDAMVRKAMGERARERIAGAYTWERVEARVERYYRETALREGRP